MSIYRDILSDIARGDRETARRAFMAMLDELGGPGSDISEGDDLVRRLNLEFTVWEQIEIYKTEVDRRPDNPRGWKLLGYVYMCAGLYVPVLLFLAEHCLQASVARCGDNSLVINLNDKIEVIANARRGDDIARKEILEAEVGLAYAFDELPAKVPVPLLFYENNIVDVVEIEINGVNLTGDLFGLEPETGETDENRNGGEAGYGAAELYNN